MMLTNRCRDDSTLQNFKLFQEAVGGSDDFLAVLRSEIDPATFHSSREFLPAYWAVESFSKTPIDIGVDREAEALRAFLEAEDLCKASTSRVFRADTSDKSNLVRRIRRRLAWLLEGICPAEVIQRARWSGGATSSLPAALASPQNKWGLATHTTSGATWWMQYWNSTFQDQAFRNLEIVESNRILTVPKNAKTDRVIAAEPDWNMFFPAWYGRLHSQALAACRSPQVSSPWAACNSSNGGAG